MKAMLYRRYGGPEVLESADLPKPTPGPSEILIKVRATSINPIDWKIASGKLRLLMPAKLPQVPGFDVAGEVVEVGSAVSGFAVGARVHARLDKGIGAAAAEFTLASPAVTSVMPDNMDFASGAGLPLAGMTALQALRNLGGLSLSGSKQRVLVIGASGGVGHLAVQIARAAGATVIGICSGRNRAMVESLGAQEVIDYQQPDPYRNLQACDIILDCVGSPYREWTPYLTPSGAFVSALPGPAVILRGLCNAVTRHKVHAVMLKSNAPDLRSLDDLAAAGKLRVIVDQSFPLSALQAAWQRSISGRAAGKIIVTVDS